jgi:hypothetical protein
MPARKGDSAVSLAPFEKARLSVTGVLRRPAWWAAAGLCLWLILTAAAQHADANYDLRNYHFYGPFALLHGRMGFDIAPAQLQGFYPPTLDLPFYVLSRLVHRVWLMNAVLALPHCLAVVLAFLIARRLLGARDLAATALAALVTLIGATGAGMLPTLATTMSDALPVACILGAVLTLMTDQAWAGRRVVLAGLLCGAAAGLKLTEIGAGVAVGSAIVLAGGGTLTVRLRRGIIYAAGALLGAAALGGWWWWRIYALTGDPVFPHFNAVFHSALIPPIDITDTRFLPKTWLESAIYPLFWAADRFSGVSELPVRDPRIAIAAIGCVFIAIRLWRHPARTPFMLVVFFAVTYALWERQFSIFRYLSALELLSGAMMLCAVLPLLITQRGRVLAFFGFAIVFAMLRAITIYPDWGHVDGAMPPAVKLPAMAGNSLVLLLDQSPMAYVAPFAPRSVRFVGANNNLIHLNRSEPLQQRVQHVLNSQKGEIWGMEIPFAWPGTADETLAFYGLRRDGCTQVRRTWITMPFAYAG